MTKPIGLSDLTAITKAYLAGEYPDLPPLPINQTLTIPAPAQLLTTNAERQMHHHARADLVTEWRWATKIAALNAHLVPAGRATIEARVTRKPKPGRTPDADAFAPTIKAVLDGLVDAKVLIDDGPKYVRSITYHACTPGDRDEVTLTLQSIDPNQEAA